MNRNTLLIGLVVIILLAVGLVFANSMDTTDNAGDGSISPTASPLSTVPGSTASPTDEEVTAVPDTTMIEINDTAFTPSSLTVKKGTTVTWTNKDGVSHTVTSTETGKGPDSPIFSTGKSYSYTFTEAGTYSYFCRIHSNMKGTVIVTE